MYLNHWQFITVVYIFAGVGVVAGGEDAHEVLARAKKDYEDSVQDYRQTITDQLDKKEQAARLAGDKRKVDEIKIQRQLYEAWDELPTSYSLAGLKTLIEAKATLDRAYQDSIKHRVKNKQDAAADAAEKARRRFLAESAILIDKRVYASNLRAFNISTDNNSFEKNASRARVNDLAIPHSIYTHPMRQGQANASFFVPPRAVAFRVFVGVPKYSVGQGNIASPLTFEVLVDDNSLWKSDPVTKLDAIQTCISKIDKGKTLTLRVHCPGEPNYAHAVWFAPIFSTE